MHPAPHENLPKVDSFAQKAVIAMTLVLVGHGLVLWGLSKVKMVEIKAIKTPPIQVQFLKIADPEPIPTSEPNKPEPVKPKPVQNKPKPPQPKPEPIKPKPEPPEPVKPKSEPIKPKFEKVIDKPKIVDTTTVNQKQLEIERERINKAQAERERADRERAERERADRERAERERADRERADRERADRERAERERADRERADRERADRERADRERADRERADRERADRERADLEKQSQTPQRISEGELAWKRGRPSISSRIIESNLNKGESVLIVIGFSAKADGSITDAWVEQSSGKPNLDQAAVRSVRSSALKPYPHPVEAKTSFKLTLK